MGGALQNLMGVGAASVNTWGEHGRGLKMLSKDTCE